MSIIIFLVRGCGVSLYRIPFIAELAFTWAPFVIKNSHVKLQKNAKKRLWHDIEIVYIEVENGDNDAEYWKAQYSATIKLYEGKIKGLVTAIIITDGGKGDQRFWVIADKKGVGKEKSDMLPEYFSYLFNTGYLM